MSDIIEMYEVERANERNGHHFFSEGNTRFFNSRYPQSADLVGDYAVFITSEQFDDNSPRLYSVRVQNMIDGKNFTVGEFNTLTRYEAQALKKEVILFFELLYIDAGELQDFKDVLEKKSEQYTIKFIFAKYAEHFSKPKLTRLEAWASKAKAW